MVFLLPRKKTPSSNKIFFFTSLVKRQSFQLSEEKKIIDFCNRFRHNHISLKFSIKKSQHFFPTSSYLLSCDSLGLFYSCFPFFLKTLDFWFSWQTSLSTFIFCSDNCTKHSAFFRRSPSPSTPVFPPLRLFFLSALLVSVLEQLFSELYAPYIHTALSTKPRAKTWKPNFSSPILPISLKLRSFAFFLSLSAWRSLVHESR